MRLVTGKTKEFITVLSRSGNGKTVLMYLLVKAMNRPAIFNDSNGQLKGAHKSLNQLIAYFSDFDNVEDFHRCKRQIITDIAPKDREAFFDYLNSVNFLTGANIVIDEIDLFLGQSNIGNDHPYYIFCNKGRHREYRHITTARATQNIPKCLTAQTDTYYIGQVANKYMINFISENLHGMNIEEAIAGLNDFEYLKIDTSRRKAYKLKPPFDLLSLFEKGDKKKQESDK